MTSASRSAWPGTRHLRPSMVPRSPRRHRSPPRSGACQARRSGGWRRAGLPTAPPMAMTPPLRRVLAFHHASVSWPCPFLRSGARQARRSGGRRRAGLPTAPPMAMTPPLRRGCPSTAAPRGAPLPLPAGESRIIATRHRAACGPGAGRGLRRRRRT